MTDFSEPQKVEYWQRCWWCSGQEGYNGLPVGGLTETSRDPEAHQFWPEDKPALRCADLTACDQRAKNGHWAIDDWCAKPSEHYSNCVCGYRGGILPGLCYCDRELEGGAHFTDPRKHLARAISIEPADGP